MRMLKYVTAAALVLGLAVGLALVRAADDAPKYTVKEVMKLAHKGGDSSLAKKIAAGKGTDEDKKKLVDLYTSLAADKPPKGELDDWKERTTDLLDAAKAVADGKDGATDKLKKAMDCGGCHEAHKPA